MELSQPERRKIIRVQVPRECELAVRMSMGAQVLGISRSGVTLASRTALEVGDRAELVVTLGNRSFALAIEIRHVATDLPSRGRLHHRAGAVFLGLNPEQRLVLDELLGAELT